MSDDKQCHGGNFFDCKAGENDRKFQLEAEFQYRDDENPADLPMAAAIHSHEHNISKPVVAQTLVILAQNLMTEHLAHTVFEGCPSPELGHAMARGAALAYLKEMVESLPATVEVVGMEIPDDISTLLEGE